jgi:hypothetical protein
MAAHRKATPDKHKERGHWLTHTAGKSGQAERPLQLATLNSMLHPDSRICRAAQ